jgi:hypothetical protein
MIVDVICSVDIAGVFIVVVKIPTIVVTAEHFGDKTVIIVFCRP